MEENVPVLFFFGCVNSQLIHFVELAMLTYMLEMWMQRGKEQPFVRQQNMWFIRYMQFFVQYAVMTVTYLLYLSTVFNFVNIYDLVTEFK